MEEKNEEILEQLDNTKPMEQIQPNEPTPSQQAQEPAPEGKALSDDKNLNRKLTEDEYEEKMNQLKEQSDKLQDYLP